MLIGHSTHAHAPRPRAPAARPQAVDFGCVLTDTLRRQTVVLTNPGKARVAFSWAWQRGDGSGGSGPALEGPEPSGGTLAGALLRGSMKGGAGYAPSIGYAPTAAAASSKAPPPRPAFDILPISGALGPGESQAVEVSFYGYSGAKAAAAAVCHVEGGPDYQVGPGGFGARLPAPWCRAPCSAAALLCAYPASVRTTMKCMPPCHPPATQLSLAGEASSIRFGVEPQFFDLGATPYDRPVERELHVANTGAPLDVASAMVLLPLVLWLLL